VFQSNVAEFINSAKKEEIVCHQTTECLANCDEELKILVAVAVGKFEKKTVDWDNRSMEEAMILTQKVLIPSKSVTLDHYRRDRVYDKFIAEITTRDYEAVAIAVVHCPSSFFNFVERPLKMNSVSIN
jgi:hypothetical protein